MNATSSTLLCAAEPQQLPPFQKNDERVPVPFGYTAMKPASSAFRFRPQNHAIIGPFIVAPCRANTTGNGVFCSWPSGT